MFVLHLYCAGSGYHQKDRKPKLPPRKRLGVDLGPRYEIGEGSSTARPTGGRRADYGFVGTMDTEIRRQRAEEVGYGIRDVWVDPRETVEEVAPMTLEGDRQTQIYQSFEKLVDDMMGQQAVIAQLQAADRRSQAMTSEMLQADHRRQGVIKELLAADHQRQVQLTKELKLLKGLQTQMAEF
ncbi:hypothetical protein Tco_1485946 [Tanacetum coccineum]